jgi:peptidyl-prolyl cis-trans isomerase B (cyclophilin B)
MNISLKTPFISLVFLFLMGCDSVQSVQKENPLVNALFKNGIDISNDIDINPDNYMNPDNYSLNKKQAICIVKNIENLANDREWERFVYEELEMDEKTDVDYLEDGFSILGDVLQGEFDSMFDSLRSFEASTSLNKLKLQSIQICDEALWSYINGYEYYEDSDDYYKDETVAEDPEQSEEAVTEDENYVLDNTATLVQGLSAGIENKINKEFTQVIIQTSEGEIKLELNNKKAPITVENFKNIAKSGYYEGTVFHRVINGFMIQGGGLTADMNEKPSGTAPIQNEANNGLSNDRGTIAMARTSAPHSATSQFFINHKDNGFLNHTAENSDGWGYAVFGVVTEGMDIVDQIADAETMSYMGYADVPIYDITIESVTIIE